MFTNGIADEAAAVEAAAVVSGAADKELRDDIPEPDIFRLLALVAGTLERGFANRGLLVDDEEGLLERLLALGGWLKGLVDVVGGFKGAAAPSVDFGRLLGGVALKVDELVGGFADGGVNPFAGSPGVAVDAGLAPNPPLLG